MNLFYKSTKNLCLIIMMSLFVQAPEQKQSIHGNNLFLSCLCRFIQIAPQYFFYNLPPSECKEFLQHILETEVAGSEKSRQDTHPVNTDAQEGQESQSSDRCVIQ